MRRRVAALIVAMLVVVLPLMLVGCGGDDEPAPEAPPVDAAAPPAEEEAVIDRSPAEPQTFEPLSGVSEVLPDSLAQRLETRQPMLILFFDASQKTSDDQREAVDSVLEDYRGLIDLIAFDMGRFVSNDEEGRITSDSSITEDDAAAEAARFAGDLGVKFTPYIVVVDPQGYITWRARGYIDEATIEREVLRATQ